jgi:hypothetical protein
MSAKSVSLTLEAYERLRTARRWPGESLSAVILRARWPEGTVTARRLLELRRSSTIRLTEDEFDFIDALKQREAGADVGSERA